LLKQLPALAQHSFGIVVIIIATMNFLAFHVVCSAHTLKQQYSLRNKVQKNLFLKSPTHWVLLGFGL